MTRFVRHSRERLHVSVIALVAPQHPARERVPECRRRRLVGVARVIVADTLANAPDRLRIALDHRAHSFGIGADALQRLLPLSGIELHRCCGQRNASRGRRREHHVVDELRQAAVVAAALVSFVDDDQIERAKTRADRAFESRAQRAAAAVRRSVVGTYPAPVSRHHYIQQFVQTARHRTVRIGVRRLDDAGHRAAQVFRLAIALPRRLTSAPGSPPSRAQGREQAPPPLMAVLPERPVGKCM
ncbi:hypothetical protein [Burkholderia diffusa]|uniref:hypothetical protein n=1 Tax=Burkholderia diffusa TaxID=488732 RepID=UPI003AF69B59